MKYFFIFIVLLVTGCSSSLNPSRFGFEGELKISPTKIFISPDESQKSEYLYLTIKGKMKYTISNETFFDIDDRRLAGFVGSPREYIIGKFFSALGNLRELSIVGEFTSNEVLNQKITKYDIFPVGTTIYHGRNCLVLFHDVKYTQLMNNNGLKVDANGSFKGYQLIDIDTGMKVASKMKGSMYAFDRKFVSIEIFEDLE